MRVVVVGASGNVGTSVLAALAADSDVESIVGIARREPRLEAPKTRWAAADVASDPLEPHFKDADAVIHLAWAIQPSRDQPTLRSINVEGSARVFEAVAAADVPVLVYASSVGAYSEGPKDRAVDETWPTGGTPTSFYARHKAAAERALDEIEAAHPELRVVRLRPALIFKREAASGIRRLFAGPLLPSPLVRASLLPLLPLPDGLRVQAVHADDVAEAYRLAATDERARGAYNVAADPVLDAETLGRALGARPVSVPVRAVRAAADLTWRLRLQPTPPGWLDMGMSVPVMDSGRIRRELGWSPRRSAEDALLELLEGIRERAGAPTPPLDPRARGPDVAAERDSSRFERHSPPPRLVGRARRADADERDSSGADGSALPAREAAGGAQQVADARVPSGGALERRRVRRIAAQQPRAVGAPHELIALGQLRQRRRHGRAPRAHQLAEDPVRERQRDHDALAADASPALGQMPEQRLQAPVDARELRDRLRRREPQRALGEPVEQRGRDLGTATPRRR